MDKSNLPGHSLHHVPLLQPFPSMAGPSAPGVSLPQSPMLSQGMQHVLYNIDRIRQQRELFSMQNQLQTQLTTFSSATTGLPFTVAPHISTNATFSGNNTQKSLDVFGPTAFEEHAGRSASMESPIHNRETAESSFSYPPFLEPGSSPGSARLEARALQSPEQSRSKASSPGELHLLAAPSAATLKRSRNVIAQDNSGSASWKRAGGAEKSTASLTTTTTTTDGLGNLADATEQDGEPVNKKRRIETPVSSNMQMSFASLSGEFDKMQSIMERYKSATEIAQKRLGHDFLEDEDIQDYGDEFKKECVGLVRFCLRNNYLSLCERIISESEKFYAETFPPTFEAGERTRWRLSDELAPHNLNNLCALLDRSNLTKLLCQRDESRQQVLGSSTLPHEISQLAPVTVPTVLRELPDVTPAPKSLTPSEPVAAADDAPHMAIIMESPDDGSSFTQSFVELVDVPSRITQADIDEFISDKRNFETPETVGGFLRIIVRLVSTIMAQRGLSIKFDGQPILQSALKKLFSQMQDKQASKGKIAITNRFLVELAIDNAALCELISLVLLDMSSKRFSGIVYKGDFEIISGLHKTGIPNFQAGDELPTNTILKNLRDGDKFSKGKVILYLKTAPAGSSINSLNDYFQTLELLLEELFSDGEKYQDLFAKDIISAALDRLVKTSNVITLHDIASHYLLRLAIKSKQACDILVRELSHMSDDRKRKFRVVRKLEFFSKAHALLKAKFYVPAPSGHRAGTEPGVSSSTPIAHAYGRTDSGVSTIEKPTSSTTANSSTTPSGVLPGEAAGSANRRDKGTKSLSNREDESEN